MRNTQLIEHIAMNYTEQKTKLKDCFFLTGGDKKQIICEEYPGYFFYIAHA